MADDFSQYERKGEDFSAYERPTPEPEWFMPGSKSEALTRGFSNAATFGFGDEVSSFLRSLAGQGNYRDLVAQERAANRAASEANPMSYLGGNVVGAIPQGLSVARNAILQGPKILPQMVGAAKQGAKFGVAQGAGEAESIKDMPGSMAAGGAMGAAANAAGIPLGAAASKILRPVANRVMGKSAQEASEQKLVDKLKGDVKPDTTPAPVPSTIDKVAGQVTLPTLGALGNMARVNMGNEKQDWSTDPYSAMVNTGMAGLQGAAAGYGVKQAAKVPGIMGDAARSALRKTGEVAENFVQSGTAGGETFATDSAARKAINAPFSTIKGYLQSGKASPNPAVQQAAEQVEAAVATGDKDVARKAAMAAQATPEGRAVSNSASPVNEGGGQFDELDAAMKRWRGEPPTTPPAPPSGRSSSAPPNTMQMTEESYIAPGASSVEESEDALFRSLRRNPEDTYFNMMKKKFSDDSMGFGLIPEKEGWTSYSDWQQAFDKTPRGQLIKQISDASENLGRRENSALYSNFRNPAEASIDELQTRAAIAKEIPRVKALLDNKKSAIKDEYGMSFNDYDRLIDSLSDNRPSGMTLEDILDTLKKVK